MCLPFYESRPQVVPRVRDVGKLGRALGRYHRLRRQRRTDPDPELSLQKGRRQR